MDFREWIQCEQVIVEAFKKPWQLNYGSRAFRKKKKTGEMLLRRLWKLGYSTYDAYLQSPHWLQFKNYYYARYPRVCVLTGLPATELHHIRYDHLGAETFEDVVPLCDAMHKLVHHVSETYGIPLNKSHLFIRDTIQKLFQLHMANHAPLKMPKAK